ncbi:MAG: cytidine deaminase [Bacteroidales bacterium]|nr:cytidine deaminase [Bacteroidales bacterium]
MKINELKICYKVRSHSELSADEQALLKAATEAATRAYAPYSHFRVGAAVCLANGEMISGCNQENAAFPSGLCAERVTVFYANAKCPDVAVDTLLITVIDEKGDYRCEPIPPCGACRQVLVETESRQKAPMRVLLVGKDDVYEFASASDLLPLVFSGNELL